MTGERSKDISLNLHFNNNANTQNEGSGYKVKFLLDHFNKAFPSAMSNSDKQSIDEHMVKFKRTVCYEAVYETETHKMDI